MKQQLPPSGGPPPSARMGRRRACLWALFQCCNPKAKAKTRKNLASAQVLEAEWPEKFPTPTEELKICREKLLKREEEITELKAERNNTRLLLEHLECPVSQSVPSLQMMAGKQQAQSPASTTSEVEVLRALKLLFAHHKALDKKMILKEENNQEKILTDGVLDVNHEQENMPSANGKTLRWSLSHEEDLAKVIELQEVMDKQSQEQSQTKERLAALSAHVTELEEDLDTARKDLLKSEEVNTKLQRDVREDDLNDKLENEIANKDSIRRQTDDKNRQVQELLELVEKLQQTLQREETLPRRERDSSIKERLRQMEAQLEENKVTLETMDM